MLYIYFCRLLSSRTPNYLPIIVARDGGNPPMSAECPLIIQVYEFRDTLTIPVIGNLDEFSAELFAKALGNVLGYMVVVVDVIPTGPE